MSWKEEIEEEENLKVQADVNRELAKNLAAAAEVYRKDGHTIVADALDAKAKKAAAEADNDDWIRGVHHHND